MKDNVTMDRRNFLDQPINNDIKTYENIKIATGRENYFITDCLLDFKENDMLIAIDLSKQQALDADLKAIKQVSFTGNLEPRI